MNPNPHRNAGIDIELYERYRPESDLREELGLSPSCCLVASFGLSWCGRPKTFVRIAKQVLNENPETCFIWMGDEVSRQIVLQASRLAGVRENTVILPHVADIRPVLSQVDVFVVTAPSAVFGYVTCEAMALGIPVVAALATNGERVIVPGRTGYMVPADDEELFATAIRLLLNNDLLRSKLGRTARKRAREEFDLSHMHYELEKVFASSTGRPH